MWHFCWTEVFVFQPAVAVPSQRDSSSPKNRAAAQQAGPAGPDGVSAPIPILVSQPPALGPALDAAAAAASFSGGHASGTAGPSPASRPPGPRKAAQAGLICAPVDALPIVCSAPPAFHCERGLFRAADAPRALGMVMGYPAAMPGLGPGRGGQAHYHAPLDGRRADGQTDLHLSQAGDGAAMQAAGVACEVPEQGIGQAGAGAIALARGESGPGDLGPSQRADGAGVQATHAARQVIELDARAVSVIRSRQGSQPPELRLTQQADGVYTEAVGGTAQPFLKGVERAWPVSAALAGQESQPTNLCLSQRADGACTQAVGSPCQLNPQRVIQTVAASVRPAAEPSRPADGALAPAPRFLPSLGPLDPYQVPSTGPSSLATQSEDHESPGSPLQRFAAASMPPALAAEGGGVSQQRRTSDACGLVHAPDGPADAPGSVTVPYRSGAAYQDASGASGPSMAEPVVEHHGEGDVPQEDEAGPGATVYYTARQDLPDDLPLTQVPEFDDASAHAVPFPARMARADWLRGHSRCVGPAGFPQPFTVCNQIPKPAGPAGKGSEARAAKRPHADSSTRDRARQMEDETRIRDVQVAAGMAGQANKRQRISEGAVSVPQPFGSLSGVERESPAKGCGGTQGNISQGRTRSEGLRLEMSSEEQEDPVSCLAQREVSHSIQPGVLGRRGTDGL